MTADDNGRPHGAAVPDEHEHTARNATPEPAAVDAPPVREPTRWEALTSAPPVGGGGLLDDLPEQGRGASPLRPGTAQEGPSAVRRGLNPEWRNPFFPPAHGNASADPLSDPDEPETSSQREEPAPAEPSAGGAPRSADPRTQDTDHLLEPNVIPFRGSTHDRTTASTTSRRAAVPASEAITPASEAITSAAEDGAVADRPAERAAAPAPEPPESARALPTESVAPSPYRGPARHAYPAAQRDAVYRAIRERRDVRVGFRGDPIPHEVLTRVLEAAHQAPSVGFSQPWDFVVIDDTQTRTRVQELVRRQREAYASSLPGARARAFSGLKVEAILDTPVNVVVTVDPTRGGRHTLGRHAQPQTAGYSASLAVENLWLAARAEGLGVGWVSFFEERALARELDLPPHLEIVAYLCVGYVDDFPTEPELSLSGWAQRRPLSWAVHRDHYGRRGLPGEAPTSLLEETVAEIGPPNARAVAEARERQGRMTTPPGALGVLEDVAVQLAGLAGEAQPPIPEPAAVAIFAGDHGVHAQGVTAWPQEVTAQMVRNFLDGGAVVNAFAGQVGAEVTVVDVGVLADLPTVPGLLPRKVARGTADFTRGPAMSRVQAGYAIEAGIEVARDLVAAGNRCLVTGDMGIANTTPSAALIAAFTGRDPAEVTGRGTGVDDAMHEHKIEVVRAGLRANRIDPADPVGVLAAVGGLEHAALTGFILGAAALRVPVLLDGVIAGAAALAAAALSPDVLHACVAGHRSSEPGHSVVLEHLRLRPLVDLELRLGEGSGALLALPLLQGAVRALREVATFDSAGVTERS
ncbi:hypothetical protein GCM10027294_50260 [Marinactinospora endophytica]